ncbi:MULTISPECIES: hypothetical protein [unclassified Salinibacterium]|uniref:hypothetical protein n=1 Tax=unclassified Salinibacterium TaxID=2632331 RepID=UPI00141F44DC|nr:MULTISPECIES: hypothetical protein [unclassified Salinibacterium]
MPDISDSQLLADTLPGSWTVGATSLPGWAYNGQVAPTFNYELVTAEPLVLAHDIAFEAADGKPKLFAGKTRWRGSHFVSHPLRFTPRGWGRWTVSGASDDRNVLVFALARSFGVPESVFVLVRHGSDIRDLRAMVASGYVSFGLSPEKFASLTWL